MMMMMFQLKDCVAISKKFNFNSDQSEGSVSLSLALIGQNLKLLKGVCTSVLVFLKIILVELK